MFSPESTDDMINKFFDSLPTGLKTLNEEMKSQLVQALHNWFNKMSLVTREEFDIQCQVLIKTRLKLEQLNATLEQLKASAQ